LTGDVKHLAQPALAVVGSRRASPLGLEITRSFVSALSATGLVIASGLALGIDAEAHGAALDAGGVTVAVSPVGLDRVYPRRHRTLAREIAHNGVLVSEFMPGSEPRRGHFHRRNRTLSGLTLGTLVVEAGCPSGSLITAAAAAQQGREVFAVPWSLRHPGGAGCLRLLADGASLACSPRDIANEILPAWCGQLELSLPSMAVPALPRDLQVVWRALGDERLSVDAVAARCHVSIADSLQHLTQLEIRGLVRREQGNWLRTPA
jgi:DNA processing protein